MIKIYSGKNQKEHINSLVRSFDRQFIEAYLIGSGVLLIAIVLCLTVINLSLIVDVESYLNSSLLAGAVIIGNQIFVCVVAGLIYKKIAGFFPKHSRRRELFWQKSYQYFENKRAKNKSRVFRQLLAEKRTERANQSLNKNLPNQETINDQFIHSKAFRRQQFSGYLLNYDSPDEQTKSRRD